MRRKEKKRVPYALKNGLDFYIFTHSLCIPAVRGSGVFSLPVSLGKLDRIAAEAKCSITKNTSTWILKMI